MHTRRGFSFPLDAVSDVLPRETAMVLRGVRSSVRGEFRGLPVERALMGFDRILHHLRIGEGVVVRARRLQEFASDAGEGDLRPELRPPRLFPSRDGTHERLVQGDDAVFDALRPPPEHGFLLTERKTGGLEHLPPPAMKGCALSLQFPPQLLQELLSLREEEGTDGDDPFRGFLPCPAEGVKRLLRPAPPADEQAHSVLPHPLQFPHEEPPDGCEDFGVEGEGDVRGEAGRVRDDLMAFSHRELLLESSEVHLLQHAESFLAEPLPEVRESGGVGHIRAKGRKAAEDLQGHVCPEALQDACVGFPEEVLPDLETEHHTNGFAGTPRCLRVLLSDKLHHRFPVQFVMDPHERIVRRNFHFHDPHVQK